jgi:fructose 1,6-bisphosphatase
LLRDAERYVVESVWSRATGEQAAIVATSRLHNIAGKYTGKDDPVMLVRTQMNFPATGEVLAPYHIAAGGRAARICGVIITLLPTRPKPMTANRRRFMRPPMPASAAEAPPPFRPTHRARACRET